MATKSYIVNGIDLNAYSCHFCFDYTIEDCVAYIKAFGKTSPTSRAHYENTEFNLWAVADQLCHLLNTKNKPDVSEPPKEWVIPVRAEIEVNFTLKELKVGD